MAEPAARPRVRLAELLAVLSLAADLGMGQPMEHVLRECLISLRLAERLGLDAADREVVYYSALIAWVGCHVDAYEQAKWFGDDTALKSDFRQTDFATAASRPLFIPQIVDLFVAEAPALCADLDEASSWDAVIGAEPALGVRLTDGQLESSLEAIADFTDVKSPYTIGHSRGVADLAGTAARAFGLNQTAARQVRLAGLVHDLGRLGVPNTIWDKQGALSHAEIERVRLHPYLTERMLACSVALAPLASIAVQHHERMNGSGYPRGLSGGAISPEGRLLAPADLYPPPAN